ncbi:hypothetical protein JTE90_000918 [Oedothorax gibbosus]|uniref:Uncharacterized protein n=1 Tax=Oedothorax gibbosus TaxID=931172 RepID=A0AAV6VT36_9ARAC|nr:hypothetical protein JTE90_000918 [Oedothorax gibbosus]
MCGELQDRLIPVPYSKSATDQAIRVVNAFRSGVDTRNNPGPSTSFQKRASTTLTGLSASGLQAPKRSPSTTVDSLSESSSQRQEATEPLPHGVTTIETNQVTGTTTIETTV